MDKTLKIGLAGLLLAAILTGCNLPSRVNPPEGQTALTLAAQTIEAQLTLDAGGLPGDGSPTTDPQTTQQPAITIAPTNTEAPSATSTEEPCDVAGFVKDVTIPDGTELLPGEEFTKTWRIINEGTCQWNSGYSLVFDDGDSMDAPTSVQVTTGTISPGTQVDISVDLVAPSNPGIYRGTWQMRNDDGVIFTIGGFWVEIEVVEPEVFSSKVSFKIDETALADLDDGSSPPTDTEDFEFRALAANDKNIVPLNGAEFLVIGSDEPSYADCNEANLETDQIEVTAGLVGDWVCFITDENRLGKFEVVSLKPNDSSLAQTLELNYVTWEVP